MSASAEAAGRMAWRSRPPRPAALVLQAALLIGLLGAVWSGLDADPRPGRIAALCALGALPALALLSPRRPRALVVLAAVAAVPAAVSLAVGVSPFALATLDGGAWRAVARVLPDGLRAAGEATFPLGPADSPPLPALLDGALAAAAALCAWQVVARGRAPAAIGVVGLALAYRWTVAPPAAPVAQGAVALAVVLVVLALEPGSRRPRRGAALPGLALAVLVVALAVAAGAAAGGGAWWNWRAWDVGGAAAAPSSYTLDLQQRYGRLVWPEHPTVVLRVAAAQGIPLRAAVLERFDGVAFTAPAGDAAPLRRDGATLTVPGASPGPGSLEQRITVEAGDTGLLVAGGRPVSFSGPFTGSAQLAFGGVRVDPPLHRGQTYTVHTRVPEPTPAQLLARSAYAPGEAPARLTELSTGYGGPGVATPVWGTGPAPPPGRYGPYAGAARLARRLAAGATSPYAVVNRVEGWLRANLTYDETPPYPPAGVPPLADFLDRTHRGFCQQFAGAMALMLRSVGIPARVAVGFTQGRWEAGRADYEVLDRDAHSWVEVLLPGSGWLPFDPTPGRFTFNPASVSSPDYAPGAAAVRAGSLTPAAVRAPAPAGPARPAPAPPSGPAPGAPPPAGGGSGWTWALLALALVPLALPAGRALRAARRRRSGSERERVLGAARELESRLAALGHPVDPAASPAERAAAVRAAVGVDVDDLYARAEAARYAPGPVRGGQAAGAWRELRRATGLIRRRTPLGRRLRAALAPSRRAAADAR